MFLFICIFTIKAQDSTKCRSSAWILSIIDSNVTVVSSYLHVSIFRRESNVCRTSISPSLQSPKQEKRLRTVLKTLASKRSRDACELFKTPFENLHSFTMCSVYPWVESLWYKDRYCNFNLKKWLLATLWLSWSWMVWDPQKGRFQCDCLCFRLY